MASSCGTLEPGTLYVNLGALETPVVITVRLRTANGTTVRRDFDVDFDVVGPQPAPPNCAPECRVVRRSF